MKEPNDKIELNLRIGLSYDINEFAKKTMTNIDAKMPTFHWLFAYKWHWSNAPSKITPLLEQVTAKKLAIISYTVFR